jgi:hypothetical protein
MIPGSWLTFGVARYRQDVDLTAKTLLTWMVVRVPLAGF